MKALRDIYKLKVDEPFKQLFTQGMITHKTYKTAKNEWVMPKEVVSKDGKLFREKTRENIHLLPGKYRIIYRAKSSNQSIYTKEKQFTVTSRKSVSVKL